MSFRTVLQPVRWSDGTPKSLNNAFTWAKPKTAAEIAEEKRKAKEKLQYDRKLATRGLTREDIARKQAERKNKHVSLGAHGGITNSERAPR